MMMERVLILCGKPSVPITLPQVSSTETAGATEVQQEHWKSQAHGFQYRHAAGIVKTREKK